MTSGFQLTSSPSNFLRAAGYGLDVGKLSGTLRHESIRQLSRLKSLTLRLTLYLKRQLFPRLSIFCLIDIF